MTILSSLTLTENLFSNSHSHCSMVHWNPRTGTGAWPPAGKWYGPTLSSIKARRADSGTVVLGGTNGTNPFQLYGLGSAVSSLSGVRVVWSPGRQTVFTVRLHVFLQRTVLQGKAFLFVCPSVTRVHCDTRNSSGDEIANVNFLYDDIIHVLQNVSK